MVNCALNKHLGTYGAGEWFFDLSLAHTALGRSTIKDLCGFDRNPDQWRCEAGLRRQEDIDQPRASRNKYWRAFRPDFSLWADRKANQLIVEGKGNGPGPEVGKAQADRYFDT